MKITGKWTTTVVSLGRENPSGRCVTWKRNAKLHCNRQFSVTMQGTGSYFMELSTKVSLLSVRFWRACFRRAFQQKTTNCYAKKTHFFAANTRSPKGLTVFLRMASLMQKCAGLLSNCRNEGAEVILAGVTIFCQSKE